MSVDQTDIVDGIIGFVRRRFPGENGLNEATRLLEGNTIDSLGLIELMTFLTDTYSIEVTDDDFSESNFESIGRVAELVERKLNRTGEPAATSAA